MKRLFLLPLLLLLFSSLHAVNPPTNSLQLDKIYGVQLNSSTSLEEFIQLDLKQIEKKRGKRLKLKEKIALKIAKNRIKKMRKKGASAKAMAREVAGGGFYILPLLLGFLFGLLGVLITWLAWNDIDRTKSAWWGILLLLLVLFIIYA